MRRMLDPTKVVGLPSTIEFDKEGNRTADKDLKVNGKLKLQSLVSNTNPDGDITKELGGITYEVRSPTFVFYPKGYNVGDSVLSSSVFNDVVNIILTNNIFTIEDAVFLITQQVDNVNTHTCQLLAICIKSGTITKQESLFSTALLIKSA